ncbi:MAG: hypothetical protein PVF10_06045 [Syntrophobacterales bacterium]
MAEIFDDWPDEYDQWFETPIGFRGLLSTAFVVFIKSYLRGFLLV